MAKSRHLSVLLLGPVLFVCGYTGRVDVTESRDADGLRTGLHAGHRTRLSTEPGTGSRAKLRQNVKRIYTRELGVREATGRNDGPQVAKYLRYAGLDEGHAWCAAFVCWVYGQAGVPNPRTPWSPALFPRAKLVWQRGDQSLQGKPQTGDIFGIWFPRKKRIAHVGFVDRWEDKYLITVEGNTIGGNTVSGNIRVPEDRRRQGVYRKRRLRSSIYQVADYIER